MRSRITVCALFIFVLLPARSETATAAFPAIHCRCGTSFSASPFQHAFWTALPLRTLSTTAAFPAIHCRCGTLFSAAPFQHAFWTALSLAPYTATAANYVIRCRCGMPVSPSFCRRSFPRWKVPGETAFCHHLLIFVISGSASEVALGGPAPVPCGEGAGQIAVSPSPSRITFSNSL